MASSIDAIKMITLNHQQKYVRAIRKARFEGMDSFQSWFNIAENVNQVVNQGIWDMDFYILTRKVREVLGRLEDKVALEIGYGGGRLINVACMCFKKVVGVDIHDEAETVETFLKNQGKTNFRLLKTPGDSIPVDSESVDFVYSFIVFQHLPSFSVLSSYIEETFRCLKDGGVAQLYFGKYSKLNRIDQLRYHKQGYKEIIAPVNQTSLVVRTSRMKQLCEDAGFRVIETGTSLVRKERVPAGCIKKQGGQNYVTLVKT